MIYVLGGGGGLNFRVFSGTTAPSSPKLYDIWVKTDVAPTQIRLINNGMPGPTTNPGAIMIKYEGDVWWSSTYINVIGDKNKSNGMPVYMYAKLTGCFQAKTISVGTGTAQYEAVDAYIYKNSQWVQFSSAWSGELYDAGNEFTSITGGWSGYTSKTNTTMTVVGARAKTGNIITFGEYKYLNVYVTASSGDPTTPIYVGVENASGTTIASYSRACANNVTLTVELGSITSGRPVFWGGTYSGAYGETYKATLTTNKVWLSKERPT